MKRKDNTMIPEPLKLINRVKASIKGYGDVYKIFDTFRTARYANDLVWGQLPRPSANTLEVGACNCLVV